MRNEKQLLSVLFGQEMNQEIEASNMLDETKKKYGISENEVAEYYLKLVKASQKRLKKLYELNAPKEIIDNEYKIMTKYVYVIAVVAFKNSLEVEYYENREKNIEK